MWKSKTLLIFIFLFLISLASVLGAGDLEKRESYDNTADADTDGNFNSGAIIGQSFSTSSGQTSINRVDLYMKRDGTLSTTLTWYLTPSSCSSAANCDTVDIAKGTFPSSDLSTSRAWKNISMAANVSPSSTYWIYVTNPAAQNAFAARDDSSPSYANGTYYSGSTSLPFDWIFATWENVSVPVVSNYTISVVDEWDGSSVNNITVNITNYGIFNNNTGNIIYTNISENENLTFNITVNGQNYFSRSFINQNLSSDSTLELYPFQPNITYYNYIDNGTYNFTRNLVISIYHPQCSNSIFYHDIKINNVINSSNFYNCTVDGSTINYTFSPEFETLFNISVSGNVSSVYGSGNYQSQNNSFFGEVNPPNITLLSYTVNEGFGNPTNNFSMICEDSVFGTLTYNLSIANNNLFYGNLSNGSLQSNTTSVSYIYGTNSLTGVCSDLFSSVTDTVTKTIYYSNITLIDEQDNNLFNITNITGARVYYDDNRSFYDFKSSGVNQVLFTSNSTSKLRFELTYQDGTIITRYADVTLVPNGDLRICAFKDNGIQAYQQLIASTTEQSVAVKNVFSDCYIGIDTTRFAFESDKILNAYSITSLYYLYTYSNSKQVYLASIDGGQESSINLDVLEFSGNEYDVSLLGQSLGVEKYGPTTIKIVYYNPYNDSTNTVFTIQNMATGNNILSMTLTDPNSMTLYFDYSTLDNSTYNSTTLFKATVTSTIDGEQEIIYRYFNPQGKSGKLNSSLAFVIMLFISIFGLTFTRASLSLSWFGVIIIIISLSIGALAVTTAGILLLQGLNIITLLFILVTMFTGNSEVNLVK